MLVDQDHLHHQRDFWRSRCAELQVICNDQYGIDNIGSTHQLIDAFLNNGVILTEKTPTGKWAMNSDAFKIIEAINGSHPIVSAVAEYRKGMKYIGSYYDPVERYTRSDGRIHPYYRQMQARTLRMSANDPAIQTFPRDPEVRNMLVAADGHSYISADFSNMEARIFACLAPDEGMKQAFRDGVDLHCYTGGLMYNGGTPIEKNDPRRQLSKSSLFSTMFGGGVEVLAITAGIPHALAQETSRTLHKAFPSIKKHSRDMQEEAATMAAMDTINHRTGIRLADGRILRMDPGDDRLYAYQNYSIQGSARMVLAHSLISMDNAGIMEHGVAVIHDEIVVEVPDDIADDVAFAIAEHMPNDVMFDLPISVGVGKPSKRFGDADH
jgi:DNA polymerase-1